MIRLVLTPVFLLCCSLFTHAQSTTTPPSTVQSTSTSLDQPEKTIVPSSVTTTDPVQSTGSVVNAPGNTGKQPAPVTPNVTLPPSTVKKEVNSTPAPK
jgi:hypothetical protein